MAEVAFFLVGGLCAVGSVLVFKRRALVLFFALAAYPAWYRLRPQPDPEARTLFRGVAYERRILNTPRPMIVHIATIDLRAPGLSLEVSRATPIGDYEGRALKTSDYLVRSKVQLAINASFFTPCYSKGLFEFYPHNGDGVDVIGDWVWRSTRASGRDPQFPALSIWKDGRVTIGVTEPEPGLLYQIAGRPLLVKDAQVQSLISPTADMALPRTAVGLSESGRWFYIVVIDGRQPGYSEGARLSELARLFVSLGARTALNLDGGGSSVMVIEEAGAPCVLSMPIHRRHPPGRERAVANHLGVRALPR